jgi:hypothetical protein
MGECVAEWLSELEPENAVGNVMLQLTFEGIL